MKNEIISKILPEVKKVIVCDSLIFVKSQKFSIIDGNKSLYLTFGAVNSHTNLLQAVVYEVKTKMIEFLLHPIKI